MSIAFVLYMIVFLGAMGWAGNALREGKGKTVPLIVTGLAIAWIVFVPIPSSGGNMVYTPTEAQVHAAKKLKIDKDELYIDRSLLEAVSDKGKAVRGFTAISFDDKKNAANEKKGLDSIYLITMDKEIYCWRLDGEGWKKIK